jgi:diguanylate cyclase (GGDEF)-like protein
MLKTLDGSIIAIIILLIILMLVYDRAKYLLKQFRVYTYLVYIILSLLIIDLLTWHFDGKAGLYNLICSYITNSLLFILQPVAPSLYSAYIYKLIQYEEDGFKKLTIIANLLFSINLLLLLISFKTGWYFYIDSENVYHRGDLFYIHELLCLILFLYSVFVIFKNRGKLEKKNFSTLLLFYLPVMAGIIIQALYFGYSAVFIGTAMSLLLVYINIQSKGIYTDYLTEVYNRRYMDDYLNSRIRSFQKDTARKPHKKRTKHLAAIMIDIDEFKLINDNFGHEVGDMALKDVTSIIKKSIRHEDVIARMGGDEFIVIMEIDFNEPQTALENIVTDIRNNTEAYNNDNALPYAIYLTFGYSLYDAESNMTAGEYLNQIDMLMYLNKKDKK